MRAQERPFSRPHTEGDFTERPRSHVDRYKSLGEVWSTSRCYHAPPTHVKAISLIRNVLAAAAHGYHFVLLCDARRPDLLHEWWQVYGAIGRGGGEKPLWLLALAGEVAAACYDSPPNLFGSQIRTVDRYHFRTFAFFIDRLDASSSYALVRHYFRR